MCSIGQIADSFEVQPSSGLNRVQMSPRGVAQGGLRFLPSIAMTRSVMSTSALRGGLRAKALIKSLKGLCLKLAQIDHSLEYLRAKVKKGAECVQDGMQSPRD